MKQETLFGEDGVQRALETPIARRRDPISSHAAAAEITKSGKRETQLRLVLEAVRSHPQQTSLELTRYASLDRYAIARRLPELERAGLVKKAGQKVCSVGRRPGVAWEVA